MAQLPPSTAEVIEFRCQYTHNVVQKRKKWNDGCLKFHTFNKLVRVFDEDNNHVGQKHWQGNDGVQDGDEFQIDNMLVSVQDLLGSTQTNVAPLFERRRKLAASPRSDSQSHQHPPPQQTIRRDFVAGPVQPIASSVTARSQHKSLSDLLGMRRGVIGKAVAPPSPFEARHSVHDEAQHNDSPSKRRRIEAYENEPWTVTTTAKPRKGALPQDQAKITPSAQNTRMVKRRPAPAKTPVGQKTLSIKSVIDLTSQSSPSQRTEGAGATAHAPQVDEQVVTPVVNRLASETMIAEDMIETVDTWIVGDLQPAREAVTVADGQAVVCLAEQPMPVATTESRAAPRKHLSLSNGKRRKNMLMCIQPSESQQSSTVLPRSHVRFDMQRAVASENDSLSDAAQISGSGHQRPPLRDTLQRSNLLRQQHTTNAKVSQRSTTSHDQNSALRKALGRTQSDPTSLRAGLDALIAPDGIEDDGQGCAAKAPKQRHEKRSLKRAQTLTAASSGEFKVPDSIFSQLPPEDDREKDDLGPWSREALDLFDWRPPDWEQRLASRPSAVTMVD